MEIIVLLLIYVLGFASIIWLKTEDELVTLADFTWILFAAPLGLLLLLVYIGTILFYEADNIIVFNKRKAE